MSIRKEQCNKVCRILDDLISRQAAIDAAEKESQVDGAYGYMDTKSIVDLLNNLPAAQPKYEELTPEETASEIASGSTMFARYCLDAMIQLKQMGYAICRKR